VEAKNENETREVDTSPGPVGTSTLSGGLGIGSARPLSEDGKSGAATKSKGKRNGSPPSSDSDDGNGKNKNPTKTKSKYDGSPKATLRSLHRKMNKLSPGVEELNQVRVELLNTKEGKQGSDVASQS
jgi:hypothetical protein